MALFASGLATAGPVGATSFRVIDLGTLGGRTSDARAINQEGHVAGGSTRGSGGGTYHAFLWRNGAMIDLGDLGGGYSFAWGINDFDYVVGESRTPDGHLHAFLWTPVGGMDDLGTLDGASDSKAWDINNAGVIVGQSGNPCCGGTQRAFIANAFAELRELDIFPGGNTVAYAINDAGVVVGGAVPENEESRPFVYDDRTGSVSELPLLSGTQSGDARGINASGQITGGDYGCCDPGWHAYIYDHGNLQGLPTLRGFPGEIGYSINAHGDVVGTVSRAFLYRDGQMIDLNQTLSPGEPWDLRHAFAINDAGQIAGTGEIDDEDTHAFMLVEGAGPPPSARTPLVFLPGIMGSKIERDVFAERDELWPRAGRWLDPFDFFLLELRLAENGTDEYGGAVPAEPTDILRRADIVGVTVEDVYQTTIDSLEARGYVEGETLFPFPFDWRKSARYNAYQLLDEIDRIRAEQHVDRVDVIAHSQGGLVALYALSLPQSEGKFRNVVTLGTPALGAAKGLGVIEFAAPCLREFTLSLPIVREFWKPKTCLLWTPIVQETVRNMPGVYELLPSAMYHNAVQSPMSFNRTSLTYSGWTSIVRANRNSNLVGEAGGFHDEIDGGAPRDPSVRLARVVGVGHYDTIVSISTRNHRSCLLVPFVCRTVLDGELRYGDGDGTVPRGSASLINADTGFDAHGDSTILYSGVEHFELPRNDASLNRALEFIEPGAGFARISRTAPDPAGGPEEPGGVVGLELEANGSVDGYATDSDGHVLGRPPDLPDPEAFLEEIPNASYNPILRTRSFFFGEPGSYTVLLTATDEDSARFRVKEHTAEGVDREVVFYVPDAAEGATFDLGLSDGTPLDSLRLDVDYDGDGTVDRSLEPVSVAEGGEVDDETPPATEAGASLSTPGASTVELLAEDEGRSGLAATYYALDGDTEAHEYAEPFIAPIGTTVRFASMDRAGNLEDVQSVVVDDASNSRHVPSAISVGSNFSRFINPRGDEDWYRFQAAGRSVYKAHLHGLTADYDLALFDESGALIEAPLRRGTESEQIRRQLEPGIYYLRVLGYNGAFDPRHPYRLDVQTVAR